MNRRLLINADDLGMNAQRSHGIFQCMEFGIVRSASLVANGSDSDAAARHARERGISVGLHLNLTEEYPLSPHADVQTITDANGHLFDHEKLLMLIADGKVNARHVEREIRAQVEWIFDVYGSPTHIDGHHHIHIEPMIAAALIPVMERYGIRFVRIPNEEPLPPFGYDVSPDRLAYAHAIGKQAQNMRTTYAQHGIGTTDHFRGITVAGSASLKNLRHILARLPEGTTELMVHPGSAAAYGTAFDLDPQRQTELRMLLDESIPVILRERRIDLISWADV